MCFGLLWSDWDDTWSELVQQGSRNCFDIPWTLKNVQKHSKNDNIVSYVTPGGVLFIEVVHKKLTSICFWTYFRSETGCMAPGGVPGEVLDMPDSILTSKMLNSGQKSEKNSPQISVTVYTVGWLGFSNIVTSTAWLWALDLCGPIGFDTFSFVKISRQTSRFVEILVQCKLTSLLLPCCNGIRVKTALYRAAP